MYRDSRRDKGDVVMASININNNIPQGLCKSKGKLTNVDLSKGV